MGLRKASIAKAVESAFTALGDIPEKVVLRRTTSDYDTLTSVNKTSISDYTITRGVFTSYQVTEVDRVVVLASDVKLILQQTDVNVTPNMATDSVLRKSKSYNILSVAEDPAEVIYILQLRAV